MRRAAPNRLDEGCPSDAGSTLVEVLLALVITSSAIFVLVGGMTTLFGSAIQNRQSTDAGIVVRNYAEALDVAVAQTGAWCNSAYTVVYTPPPPYTVPTAVLSACPAAGAPQFQNVTISETTPNGGVETLHMVVRQP